MSITRADVRGPLAVVTTDRGPRAISVAPVAPLPHPAFEGTTRRGWRRRRDGDVSALRADLHDDVACFDVARRTCEALFDVSAPPLHLVTRLQGRATRSRSEAGSGFSAPVVTQANVEVRSTFEGIAIDGGEAIVFIDDVGPDRVVGAPVRATAIDDAVVVLGSAEDILARALAAINADAAALRFAGTGAAWRPVRVGVRYLVVDRDTRERLGDLPVSSPLWSTPHVLGFVCDLQGDHGELRVRGEVDTVGALGRARVDVAPFD
jgi:hypothetical protein